MYAIRSYYGQTITSEAPLDQIPLFIKQGAIVPMREYTRSIEAGTNDILTLEIFAGANGTFRLIEDDGSSNDYLKGKYALTEIEYSEDAPKNMLIIQPVKGTYDGMNDIRTWKVVIRGANRNNFV